MAISESISAGAVPRSSRDIFFALGIVVILAVLFLPIPAFLIDVGLAFSIALSVLIEASKPDTPDIVAWQRTVAFAGKRRARRRYRARATNRPPPPTFAQA